MYTNEYSILMRYEIPSTIAEALQIRAGAEWQIIAGGTDVYPSNVGVPPLADVLDISRITDLRGITQTESAWRIGALTTWTELLDAQLPAAFDALKLAASEVGSVQIQNVATIVGNLCNASPAADGVPPLLILDARVELSAVTGSRELPLAEFLRGNRRTAMRPDEIMTAIVIPRDAELTRSHFLKLGSRKYLVISIAMVAAQLRVDNGRIRDPRIAVGACSVVARRLTELERALDGAAVDTDLAAVITSARLSELAPIDDIRSSATYRRGAAATLVRRSVEQCLRPRP